MKQETKRPIETVVIFKKKTLKNRGEIYIPVDVELGYLDEDKFCFVTMDKQEYHHLLKREYLYGFSCRIPLKDLKELFGIKNSKNLLKIYLRELKEYKYFFDINEANGLYLINLMAENKKTHQSYPANDIDLVVAVEKLKEEYFANLAKEEKTPESKLIESPKLSFDTKSLADGVKSEVIGQDHAIDDMITIIWKNQRSKKKSNALLIGPTGTGKTEIIRNITKRLGIPMITINAANLTKTGFLGESASDAIGRLIKKANNDIEKASRGIIYIDEIDKIAGQEGLNSEIATTGVQDELLKLLEDGDYEVNISDNQFAPKYVTFNTENVTFICSGAFSQLKAKKQAKLGKPISGFGQSSSSSKPNNENTTKITTEDLVTYGLKEELVGRLPNIIELNNLSKDNLITIMKNPNNSVLNENIKIFEELGVSVNVEEEIYNLVAERALKKNTGARGLTSVIDNLFIKAMNDISQNPDSYSELIITKETLDNPKKYTLVRKKDN